jgi:predicted anti-sigma-YlaC factor YlaD
MPYDTSHLGDEVVAAYLEGNTEPDERLRLAEHLAECSYCCHRLIDTYGFLVEADLLPPNAYVHPLERPLAALRQAVPVPKRNWPFLLLVTITVATITWAWLLMLNVGTLSQRSLGVHRELGWLASVVLVVHLLLVQPELRWLITRLWWDGVPQASVSRLNTLFAWHQGWPLGGGWLFVILAAGMSTINLIFIPNASGRSLAGIASFLSNMALAVLFWGWFWAGLFCCKIATIMNRTAEFGARTHQSMPHAPALQEQYFVLEKARWLALQWVVLASFFVSWRWGYAKSDLESGVALRFWAPALMAVLVVLWLGYAYLELGIIHLSRKSSRARKESQADSNKQGWPSSLQSDVMTMLAFGVRLGFSLALALLPIWVLANAG